jgi:hypothetical protein
LYTESITIPLYKGVLFAPAIKISCWLLSGINKSFNYPQIFLVVYFPVWIDFFAGPKKTLWLTFMQLGVALGAVAGYFVTSIFIANSGDVFSLIITLVVITL